MDQKRLKVDLGVEKAIVIICRDVENISVGQFNQLVAEMKDAIQPIFEGDIIPKLNVSELEKLKLLVSASSFPLDIKNGLINSIESRLQFISVLDNSRENNIKRDENRSQQNTYVPDPDMMRSASEAIMAILSTELDAKSFTRFKTLMVNMPIQKRAVLIADVIVPRIDDAKLTKLQKLLSRLPQVDVSWIMNRVVRKTHVSKASKLLSDEFTIGHMVQSLPDEKDGSIIHLIRSYLEEFSGQETEFTTDLPKLIVDFLYFLVCQKALDWHNHQPIWCQDLFAGQIRFLEDHLQSALNQASSNLIVEFDRIWDQLMGDPLKWFKKISKFLHPIGEQYRFLVKILQIQYRDSSSDLDSHLMVSFMKNIEDISKRLVFAAYVRVLLLNWFFDAWLIPGILTAEKIIQKLSDIGISTKLGEKHGQNQTRSWTTLQRFMYTAALWIPSLAQTEDDKCFFDKNAPRETPHPLRETPSIRFYLNNLGSEWTRIIFNQLTFKILYGFAGRYKNIHETRWGSPENKLIRPGNTAVFIYQNIIPENDDLDKLTWIRDYHPNNDVSSLPMELFGLLSSSNYRDESFPFNRELMTDDLQGHSYTLMIYSTLIYDHDTFLETVHPVDPRQDDNPESLNNMKKNSDFMKKHLYPTVSKLFEQRTKPKPKFADREIETFIHENSIEAPAALYRNASVSNPFGAPAD